MSYSSVLDRSISARREALYKSRGLDIERWVDLVGEAKALKREIGEIAKDYDESRRARASNSDGDKPQSKGAPEEKKADVERADMAEADSKV